MRKMRLLFTLAIAVTAFVTNVYGQGVTTSSMTGKVIDNNGKPIYAANVLATHVPTGTQYGTITMEDGRFQIRNMKIGGSYKVVFSFVDSIFYNI